MSHLDQHPDTARPAALPDAPGRAPDERVVGATAIALAISLLAQNAIAALTDPPTYAAPMSDVLAYHAHNPIPVGIAVGLEALNLPLLLGFVSGLHGLVGRRRAASAVWSRLAAAAAASLTAIMVAYAVLWIGVVLAAGRLTEPTLLLEIVWRMHAAAFAFSLPALGTTLLGAALATHTTRLTARWQLVLGVVSAALLMAAGTVSLAIADGSPILFVGLAGYAGWIVWLLASGVRLVRTRGDQA